jgi:hypothetical protein
VSKLILCQFKTLYLLSETLSVEVVTYFYLLCCIGNYSERKREIKIFGTSYVTVST